MMTAALLSMVPLKLSPATTISPATDPSTDDTGLGFILVNFGLAGEVFEGIETMICDGSVGFKPFEYVE